MTDTRDDIMTMTAIHPTDDQDSAEAVAALAAEAESAEQAEQRASEADQEAAEGQWEDVEEQERQARELAKMGVQGVEMAAGLIRPGHSLTGEARKSGEESLLPVALDFSGEIPEWLRPYMHYLSAGLWIGGVLVGAYKAKREDDAQAERERRQAEGQGAADGE